MECLDFRKVSFTYPAQTGPALCDISIRIGAGECVLLCGPSGCGKSTLLRQCKPCLSPCGHRTGEIRLDEKRLQDLDERALTQRIGFVLQSPENQVVTDKVWHELAFGLESLGYDTPTIRRRVAEIAAFFGIEHWFHKQVTELSGGQKQLLSLASVLAMNPELVVLDEPTAQLDPIAAADFLALLGRINRELGITILLTEHRLEEAFPYATRVVVMERGSILCDEKPEAVGHKLRAHGSGMFLAMPTALRVWAAVETALACPLSVRDGSRFLTERSRERALRPLAEAPAHTYGDRMMLQCEELWFRYEKKLPDVVRGFSLALRRGEFYALLGGNGAGKTTALKVIAGLRAAYRGKVQVNGRVRLLPQDPQTLFVCRTVREELWEALRGEALPREEPEQRIAQMAELCALSGLLERHPYDLSGGEQQRCALAKVLLTSPELLLLDEPTKGFDAEFKRIFAGILEKLLAQGVTILMVSHDVAFCAAHAHRCGLFFDGSIVADDEPRAFFSGNSFYTTPANRMARHLIPQAVTPEELIACCGGTDGSARKSPEACDEALPQRAEAAPASSSAEALAGQAGSRREEPAPTVPMSDPAVPMPAPAAQTPREKRRLSRRTRAQAVCVLLLIPLTIFAGIFYLDDRHYDIVALLILLECMLPFALVFEGRKPQPRELVTIAVLCAIGVAGRSLFFMLPQFKPVAALTIIAGVAFGGEAGFLVGAATMLVSNMLTSQGPWTPWQMFAMGIIGFLAGILFRKGLLRRTSGSLAVFGALSTLIIYGGIMNPASAFMIAPESISAEVLLAYYVSGLPMDLVHALGTAVFLLLAAKPMLEKMDRIKVKYGLVESPL